MANVDRFGGQRILNGIISWGTRIFFILAIIVCSVLSFVQRFDITPDIRKITTMALIAAVLNWLVWDSYYRSQYEKILTADVNNKQYCIHKRYYDARKDWKYKDLQDKIHQYNKDFEEAWEKDVEDVTGRTIAEIKSGPYKKQRHKILIWRIKHHRYPKTGLRTPNDVLYILSVGKADSMKIRVKAEEHFHAIGRMQKFIMLALGALLVASLSYEFISGDWMQAIVTLILQIGMMFMSLFFGAMSGINGGKLKLSTAEIVSERLEEWKNSKPSQEPYQTIEEVETINKSESKSATVELV